MRKLITMKFILYFLILWGASVFSAAPNYSYLSFLKENLSSLSLQRIAENHSKEIIDFIIKGKKSEEDWNRTWNMFHQDGNKLIVEVAAANPSYFFENIKDIKLIMSQLQQKHWGVGPFPVCFPKFVYSNLEEFKSYENKLIALLKSGIFDLYTQLGLSNDFIRQIFAENLDNLREKEYKFEFIFKNALPGCFFTSVIHALLKNWIEIKYSKMKKQELKELKEITNCYFSNFDRYWALGFKKEMLCNNNVYFFFKEAGPAAGYLKSLDTFLFTNLDLWVIPLIIKAEKENHFLGDKEKRVSDITDGNGNDVVCAVSMLFKEKFKDDSCSVIDLEEMKNLLMLWAEKKISFFQRNKKGICAVDILVDMNTSIIKELFLEKNERCQCSDTKKNRYCSILKAHQIIEWTSEFLNSIELVCSSAEDWRSIEGINSFYNYIDEIRSLSDIRNAYAQELTFSADIKFTYQGYSLQLDRLNENRKARGEKPVGTAVGDKLNSSLNEIYSPFCSHFKSTNLKGASPEFLSKVESCTGPITSVIEFIANYLADWESAEKETVDKQLNFLKDYVPKKKVEKDIIRTLLRNICEQSSEPQFLQLLPIVESLFTIMQQYMKEELELSFMKELLNKSIEKRNFSFTQYILNLAQKMSFLEELKEEIKKVKPSYFTEKKDAPLAWLIIRYKISFNFFISYYSETLLMNVVSCWNQEKMPDKFEDFFYDLFMQQLKRGGGDDLAPNRYALTHTPEEAFEIYMTWFSSLKTWGVDIIHFTGEDPVRYKNNPRSFKELLDKSGCTWLHRLVIAQENDQFINEISSLSNEKFMNLNKFSFLGVALRVKNSELFDKICSYRIKKNLFITSEEVKEFIKFLPPDLSSQDYISKVFESENFKELLSLDQKYMGSLLKSFKEIKNIKEHLNTLKQIENELEQKKREWGEKSFQEILQEKENEINLLTQNLNEKASILSEKDLTISDKQKSINTLHDHMASLSAENKKLFEKCEELEKFKHQLEENEKNLRSTLEKDEKEISHLKEELQKEKQRCAEEVIKTEAQSKKLTEYISSLKEISDLAKAENEGLLKKCKELEKFRHQFEENEKNPCSALEKDEKGSSPLKEELQKEKQRCAEEVIKTEEQNKKLTEYINSLKKNSDIAKAGTLISGLVFVESILEPLFKSRALLKEEWRKEKSYKDKLSFITKEVYRTYKESIKSANPIFSRVTTSAIASVLFFCIAKHVDVLSKA